MISKNSKIFVAGHKGMLGSAIYRKLKSEGYNNIITRSKEELDLTNQNKVNNFFQNENIDVVLLAAGKVGGIEANRNDLTNFLITNMEIEMNVIRAAFENKVKHFVFMGSSCIYPKDSKQPIKEKYLLTGPLEPTNEGYAIAKIAGLKACEYINKEYNMDYISVMPTNLYGVNDNFDPINSHVISGIMQRMHIAKENNDSFMEIWGTGEVYREFLYVDDAADAIIFLMNNYSGSEFVNIGSGVDMTIKELAFKIKDVVGFEGELRFDDTKPDGMYRKHLDVTKLTELGWKPKTSLEDGLKKMYNWFLENNCYEN